MSGGGEEVRRPGGARSELALRTASGIVLAAAAIGATVAGGPVFTAFWLAASVAIVFEWMSMTGVEPRWPLVLAAAAGLAATTFAPAFGFGPEQAATAFAVTCAALAALGTTRTGRLLAVAGLCYAALVALVPPFLRDRPDLGILAIVWLFAVVWTTDIAGYFVGRSLGGPKLWPRVSPKKTWSGFLGGVVGAMLAGTAVAAAGPRFGAASPLGLGAVALLSAVAAVASQGGDLAESAMKRRCGVKDSGRLIPGHGGVMDRLDGFVAVCLLVAVAMAGTRLAAR